MTATVGVQRPPSDLPKRASCSHTPKWQKFQQILTVAESNSAKAAANEVHGYQKQYSHVYSHRLVALKARCWSQLDSISKEKESKGKPVFQKVHRVLELRENVASRLVGTLVKETNDPAETPLVDGTECRASDQLFLEDESGRVALEVENVHQYCTGVVVGIQGTVDDKGCFSVQKLVLPAPAPPKKLVGDLTKSTSATPQTPHLLLVSSLMCGDPNVSSLPREMLLSYLQGQFTKDADKVCRVLIAGGGPSAQADYQLDGVREVDGFAASLARSGIPLDIMPSQNDPTTANWPQRPLHSSLLPRAFGTNIVQRTPNPYAAGHGSHLVIGSDGLNVRDLQQRAVLETTKHDGDSSGDEEPDQTPSFAKLDALAALQKTLEWSHMCPTGPDSVPTVPHVDQDPMVLTDVPQIYFCGNSDQFATKKVTLSGEQTSDDTTGSTTLICVPKFSETGEAVLINLETLAVEVLRFEDSE